MAAAGAVILVHEVNSEKQLGDHPFSEVNLEKQLGDHATGEIRVCQPQDVFED